MDSSRDDLSGTWQGLYSYTDGREPVAFVAVLIDAAGSLGGTTHERFDFVDGHQGYQYATLSGQRTGSGVTFVKTYDGSGEWVHSVDYDGAVNEDGTEITGQWQVQDEGGLGIGPFLMMRANSKEDAVIRRARQPVSES